MKLINDISGEAREQPVDSSIAGIRVDRVELDLFDINMLVSMNYKQIHDCFRNLQHRFRHLPPNDSELRKNHAEEEKQRLNEEIQHHIDKRLCKDLDIMVINAQIDNCDKVFVKIFNKNSKKKGLFCIDDINGSK